MPLVPQENPDFFNATMLSVEIITSVVSAAFCLLTFASFFVLKSNVTNSHKLIIFLQINDLARAINTFLFAVTNLGDPRECDGACKVVGVVTLWTNFNHAQLAMLICYFLYMQIVKRTKNPNVNIYLIIGLFNLFSFVMAIIPLFAYPIYYFNYSWWVDIGCLLGKAAFIYLQVPILICEVICIITSVMISKTIAQVATSAPICSADNYKVNVIAKISSLPLAFAVTFLPSCLYHFVLFFGYLEFSTTAHYAFAPIMMFFYGSIGAVNSIIYLRNHGIGPKFVEAYTQRKTRLFRGISLSSSGAASIHNTADSQRSILSSPPSSPDTV